ncbi:unnamed protein product [Arctogadus glacialis]
MWWSDFMLLSWLCRNVARHDVEVCFSNGYPDTGVASGPDGWLRVACGVLMRLICAGCQSAVLRCQSTPQRRQPKQAVICCAGVTPQRPPESGCHLLRWFFCFNQLIKEVMVDYMMGHCIVDCKVNYLIAGEMPQRLHQNQVWNDSCSWDFSGIYSRFLLIHALLK